MMKNLLHILIFLISIVTYAQDEVTTDTNFSGRHCRGTHGLCSSEENRSAVNSNTVITYHNNTITFTINRSLIDTTEEIQIIGRPIEESDINTTQTFIMDDDFTLDSALISSLKIPIELAVIKAGNYPVYVSEEHLLITF